MSSVLKAIGLTQEGVRRLLPGEEVLPGVGLTKYQIQGLLPQPSNVVTVSVPESDVSLDREMPDLTPTHERITAHEMWLVGLFACEDRSPTFIAACLGVSEESVRRRLRAYDLFGTGGKRGRPKTTA